MGFTKEMMGNFTEMKETKEVFLFGVCLEFHGIKNLEFGQDTMSGIQI